MVPVVAAIGAGILVISAISDEIDKAREEGHRQGHEDGFKEGAKDTLDEAQNK